MSAPNTSFYNLKKQQGLTVKTNMVYSRRAMGFLWDKRTELDPSQVAILTSLYNRRGRKTGSVGECSFTSTYKHSAEKAGKLGYGRIYGTAGSLEWLERECRGTLCRDYYHDIDIVNAHATFLLQYAKRNYNKDLIEVQKYVDNRDKYLATLSDNRDDAKKAICSAMFNGKPEKDFIVPFHSEVLKFAKFCSTQPEHAELFNACKSKDNVYGSFLSFILQTIELDIMLTMKSSLETLGWSVEVLAFDGVMVRKRENDNVEQHMRTVEQEILDKTGFEVKLLVKPFEYFELPSVKDEIVSGVLRDDYLQMKTEFEQNHFYFIPTNQFGMYKDGEVVFLDLAHATELFQAKWRFKTGAGFKDYVEFFKLWREDPERRMIKDIDFKESDDPEIFTQPLEFAFSKVEGEVNQEAIDLFLKLLRINTNNDEVLYDWLLKYYAHMLQKPFERPNVAIVKTGPKRTGKDTPDDFIIDYVVGNKYGINYQNNQQFFGNHDCGRRNKFFAKLEEADRKLCLANSSYLKSIITGSRSMFNPKGKQEYSLPNYIRLVFTTNKANPMEMNDGEERFLILACSSEMKGNMDFWTKVRSVLFTKEGGMSVGKYLMNVDLSTFNIHKLPVNAYQKEVVESEKTSEERFVESWDGEKVSSSEFYRSYRNFCVENDIPYCANSAVLGRLLLKMVRDGVLKSERGSGNVNYYWKD